MSDGTDDTVQRARARVGTTLNGKWRLDALLGVGGMACVYAATHRNAKRAAIKILHPELSFRSDIRARFVREGYVANTVGHPGAVSVLDDDVAEDGAAFIVMELLEGETVLGRAQAQGGRLPAGEALAIADQLLDVLAAAHAKGIVHRDIKPENLFLEQSGQLKVLDFGIARLRESDDQSGTRTGSLMGTPSFMPPEQARGRWDEVDARTDLWAVGATIFSLLTGRMVHVATTANEALALAITEHAPSLGAVLPSAPREIVALVDRALAYKKEDRYPDAKAMQAALREVSPASLASGADAGLPATFLHDATAGTLPAVNVVDALSAVGGGSGTTTLGVASSARVETKRGRSPAFLGGAALVLIVAAAIAVLVLRRATPADATPEDPGPHAAASVSPQPLPPAPEPAPAPPASVATPAASASAVATPAQSVAKVARPAPARPAPTRPAKPAPRPAPDSLGGRL